MVIFTKIITKLLNEYKCIIKKHLTRQEWTAKINELGLRRKTLKHDSEIVLYQKAKKVVEDISSYLHLNSNNMPSWHSGLDEFCQYLKNTLNDYQLENNKMVHTSQQVSRALVEAVQLINLPNLKRNTQIARKLETCGHVIAKHGSREQQDLFGRALKNYQHHDVNFFQPLIHSFEKYAQDFSSFLKLNESEISL